VCVCAFVCVRAFVCVCECARICKKCVIEIGGVQGGNFQSFRSPTTSHVESHMGWLRLVGSLKL